MIDDLSDQERYSVCVANVEVGYERLFYKFFRIADYDPETPTEIAPSVVESDVRAPEERRAHPNYLYNPQVVDRYEDRVSDFYLFRWGWGYDDRGRPLTEAEGVERFFKRGRELKEVIAPEGVHNEEDLRRALRAGIPFEGKTTRIFYLVYGKEGPWVLAAKCDRSDFSFSDGLLSLPPKVTNVRGHALRVPRLKLDPDEIIEPAHASVASRRVYGVLDELESNGNVLLRLLDDFADDYVRWFINQEKIDQVTKAERQRVMRSVIEGALDRPDALEKYLEAGVPNEDVEALKHAIVVSASDSDDESRKLIRSALLRDEAFRAECVDQVMEESTAILKQREKEIDSASARLESVRAEVSAAENRLAEAVAERDSIRDEILKGQEEVSSLAKDKESALEELESSVALKLGLKAVSSAAAPVKLNTPGLSIVTGEAADKVAEAESLRGALSENMGKLGISCLVGDPDEVRGRCAVGIEAALSATNIFAIPMPIALPMADALSVALTGKTAKRVRVPSDYRSVLELLSETPDAGEVTVFENVIDPVNEGALFALANSDGRGVIILPFTSHASASLVAKEAWDRVFLPNVESLCLVPSLARRNRRLSRMREPFSALKVDGEEVLDTTRGLISDLEELNLPDTSLLLPATVLTAFDALPESENEVYGPLSIVSLHLGIVTGLDGGSFEVLAERSEGDVGLLQLARRLERDAS